MDVTDVAQPDPRRAGALKTQAPPARLNAAPADVVEVDRFADNVPLPAFGPRMLSLACGSTGAADVRPNWIERKKTESLTGVQWGSGSGDNIAPYNS